MADSTILPGVRAALVASDGTTTREFYRFFSALAPQANLPAQVDNLTVRVGKLENGGTGGSAAKITGAGAVSVIGTLAAGIVKLDLKPVVDSGEGSLLAITVDGQGRIAGTRSAVLADVSNVNISGTPTDGYVLTYDNATSKWLPKAGGIQSVVAGTNVTIDATDPLNPIINATGGGADSTLTWLGL
jgi:hypothetical protein